MKKLSDKTIRQIIVVVGLALSLVLILMIGSKFKKEPITETQISQQNSEAGDVVVEKPKTTEKEIIVPPIITVITSYSIHYTKLYEKHSYCGAQNTTR